MSWTESEAAGGAGVLKELALPTDSDPAEAPAAPGRDIRGHSGSGARPLLFSSPTVREARGGLGAACPCGLRAVRLTAGGVAPPGGAEPWVLPLPLPVRGVAQNNPKPNYFVSNNGYYLSSFLPCIHFLRRIHRKQSSLRGEEILFHLFRPRIPLMEKRD